jgi:pSer/pThr/pTyr-binding forkhead associated (FHA) protein/FixJ family two-component response regulator
MSENSLWMLELSTPQMPKPFRVRVEDRIIIGRSTKNDSQQPDVDLASFGAEELGVSRQHLVITSENNRLNAIDLGSGNGTILNGTRMNPNENYPLTHDDQLQLGRLKLHVQVIVSPSQGGVMHKQPSLQLSDQSYAGRGQSVLIVEEHPEVAKVLSLIMEEAGYKPRISTEVVGAMRFFNQKRPAAAIVDVMLSDMNGLEFCRYVRRDIHQNTMPMVVINASKSLMSATDAMIAGADIFLDRPVSAKELRHVVSALIYQHESGDATIHTKHLVGTAPLKGVTPESRRDSAVFFVAGYGDAPIVVNVQQPVSFGRTASTGDLATKSHIDLSRYDAVNYGVSRVHIILHNNDGQFQVEDMGTVNGTYLNGNPLTPREPIAVKNADEIRLGRLRMYIYFIEDGER